MHYYRYAFSDNDEPTITPIDSTTFIGQRTGLSEGDMESINTLYPKKAVIKKEVNELTIKYRGNYPSDKGDIWTEECQGISNNDNNWFITQNKTLWKVPFSKDLRKSFTTGDGTLKVGIPKQLKDLGYNHFGDCDNYNGYIFIPVQGSGNLPVIAVFNEVDLSYIDFAEIKGKESGAWCAINPITTHLTTSHTHISPTRPIEVYSINWDILEKYNRLVLTEQEGYYMQNLPQGWNNNVTNPMQGGDWSTDGCYLYLSNGYPTLQSKNRGLSVYKNIGNTYGEFVMASEQGGDEFRFQWSPGWRSYEEPQGLTYYEYYNDISDKIGLTHLHAILLSNDLASKDDVYIKHYYVEHPSCGGCNDACAENYMPNALYDDDSCEPYDTICDDNECNTIDSYDSENCECVNQTITAPICNIDPCSDGGIYEYDDQICECVLKETTSFGCTDKVACNFNPLANCDDDSCDYGMSICSDPCYPISGCTNQFAYNYNPQACIADDSCNFDEAPQFHPNPASSNVSVTIDNDMLGAQIFITNIHGTAMPVVLNGSTDDNTFSLDVSMFDNGIYYLMAVKGDRVVYGSFSKF